VNPVAVSAAGPFPASLANTASLSALQAAVIAFGNYAQALGAPARLPPPPVTTVLPLLPAPLPPLPPLPPVDVVRPLLPPLPALGAFPGVPVPSLTAEPTLTTDGWPPDPRGGGWPSSQEPSDRPSGQNSASGP
jgi:hypothetical protein